MAQISLFALSAIQVALAAFVWRACPASIVHRRFAAQTLLLAIWIFGVAGLQAGVHLDVWGSIAFASASLIPAAFLAFTSCYPPGSRPIRLAVLPAAWLLGAVFALLSVTSPLIVFDNQISDGRLSRRTGPLYAPFVAYFIVAFLAALAVLIGKLRSARGLQRAQLQYLVAGIAASAAGGIGANLIMPFLTGSSLYSWIGPYFSLCLVALTGHAIIRHRLLDLRLVVHQGLVYGLAFVLLSLAAMAIGRTVADSWTAHRLIITFDLVVFAAAAFVVTSPLGRRLINRVFDPYLYRRRLDYAAELRRATHRLNQLMTPDGLASELRAILVDAFIPESLALVVKTQEDGQLEILTVDPPEAAGILRTSDTLQHLLTANPPRTVWMVNPDVAATSSPPLLSALVAARIEIVVALHRREQILGFLLLGPRRSGDAYFKSDLSFMESLSELASIAVENSLLYRHKVQMLEYADRLLESLDSAVVAVDAAGAVTSCNTAAHGLLQLPKPPRSTLADLPSEVGWALALALRTEWHPQEVEVFIEHASRAAIPAILSTAVLRDDRRITAGALVVVTDLSKVKALERNQRRAEHLAMMARFYAGITHEIRSPLASISNFIAMLPDRFDDPEYRATAVRLLPSEVARIVRLADRLRLMAPSEEGHLIPVDLQRLLRDIVAMHSPAAAESAITIMALLDDDLPAVTGDPSQLVQLFVNLLRNAIEAMPDGGCITIQAGRAKLGDERVVVRVIDEGDGLDPLIRSKIFEPFFTTKPSGTGLGLSISREIAEFHGAALTLAPRPGVRGAIAQVTFPQSRVSAGSALVTRT